jgi:hypothetical protein
MCAFITELYLLCVTLPPTMQLHPLPRYLLSHFDSGYITQKAKATSKYTECTVVISVKTWFSNSCYNLAFYSYKVIFISLCVNKTIDEICS